MAQSLITLTDVAAARNAGIPVHSTHQLRWLERTADTKGLRPAFIRVGRRVFLDPAKFHELVRGEQSAA